MWPDLDISICIGPCNALPVSLPHTPPYAYFFSMWTFFQRTQSLSSLMDSGRGWGPGHQTYSISCNSWGYLQSSLCKSMQCYQLKIYYLFTLFTNMFLFFQLWCFPLASKSRPDKHLPLGLRQGRAIHILFLLLTPLTVATLSHITLRQNISVTIKNILTR